MREYHHTKFGFIWIKESKVTEGGGGFRPDPQVEIVLNRPGEIGLNISVDGSEDHVIHCFKDDHNCSTGDERLKAMTLSVYLKILMWRKLHLW